MIDALVNARSYRGGVKMFDFNVLLQKLDGKECIQGTYVRKAVESDGMIQFDSLLVRGCGSQEFISTDEEQRSKFFQKAEYQGYATNSSSYDNQDQYETVGYWHTRA